MKLHKFEDHLNEMLQNPEFAIAYMQTALEDDGVEEFLYALRKVAVAQGGIQKIAEASHHGRESLYKSLSKQGNPRVKTLDDILRVMGMRLAVTRDEAVPQTPQEQDQAAVHA